MKLFAQNSAFKEYLYLLRARLAKPEWVRQYKEVMAHDAWTPEQIHEFNFARRCELLRYAYENSPYYHKLYAEAGLEPDDVKTEDDWVHVPALTRDALRSNYEDIKVRDLIPGSYQLFATGGSTGTPSKVLKDMRFATKALKWRTTQWAGVRLGQDNAVIMRAHSKSMAGRFRAWLSKFPSTNIALDASEMTDANMAEFVKQWQKIRPATVEAYVGGAHQLALYCQRHGIELPPPLTIHTTAAPLDLVSRREIANAFHAPVFDSYVATEAHPMADQCRVQAEKGLDALHIHADYFHIDVVDEKFLPLSVGEEGDILVTDTGNRVFPIIRYKIGDRGHLLPGRCPCGRPYPLMGTVKGRDSYHIYLEHGILTGGWAMLFEKYPNAVHGFQVHQYADKSVKLFVVMNHDYANAENEVALVAEGMRQKLGALPLTVQPVDEIPHDRGKIRFIICDVKEENV